VGRGKVKDAGPRYVALMPEVDDTVEESKRAGKFGRRRSREFCQSLKEAVLTAISRAVPDVPAYSIPAVAGSIGWRKFGDCVACRRSSPSAWPLSGSMHSHRAKAASAAM